MAKEKIAMKVVGSFFKGSTSGFQKNHLAMLEKCQKIKPNPGYTKYESQKFVEELKRANERTEGNTYHK